MAGAGTNLATYFVQIVPTTKGIKNNLAKQVGAPVDAVGKKAGSSLGQKMGKWAKKSLKAAAVGGVAAAGAAIASGFGIAMAKGFQRLNAIDQAEKKLQGLGHSAKAVEGIMRNALNSVKGTAFGLDEAANVSASLVASGIKPGKELEQTLKTVADSATIAGIGMEDMGAIFGKVAATGKLQGDELNQLSERGIPSLQLLSDHLGVTTQEVRDMVSKGQVDFQTFAAAMNAGMGGAAQKSGETFMGAWANVKAALGRIGATLLEPLFEALKDSFNVLTPALDQIQASAEPLAQVFGDMLKAVMPLVTAVFTGLVQAFVVLADALGKNAGLVKALTGVVVFAATAYAGWAAGAKMLVWYQILHKAITPALTAVLKGQVTVTGLLSKGWKALSAAMAANPIGVVIVALLALGAIFVLMYKKVGWFRDMVDGVWAWLKKAAAGFVEGWGLLFTKAIPALLSDLGKHFKGTFDFIVIAAKLWWTGVKAYFMFLWELIKGIGRVFVWLYENAVKPAFDFIVAAAKLWWQGVKLYFKAVWTGVQYVGKFFVWLYEKAVKPAFDFIVLAAKLWWTGVKLYFTAVINGAKAVGRGFVWLYEKIKAAFNFIVNAAKQWWARTKATFWASISFIRTVFWGAWSWLRDKIAAVWSAITTRIRNAWSAIKATFWAIINYLRGTFANAWNWLRDKIKNIWGSIRSHIANTWSAIKNRTFNPMMNFIKNTIPNAFRNGVSAIKRAWDKLKSVARSPVKFVIQKVINDGLIGTFNKVAGKFPGAPTLAPVGLPRGFARGGWTGPGARLTPAGIVHADEFVIKKSSRRRFEAQNPGLLDHINRTGRLPMFGGYAGGGKVGTLSDAARWLQSMGVRITEFKAWGQRVGGHAPNSYHYSGRAFDANYGPGGQNSTEMEFFDRIVPQLHQKFPTLRTIWRAPGHYNHLHVDTGRGGSVGSTGPGGSGGGFSLGTILSPFTKMKDKLKNQFTKWGDMGKLVAAMAKKTINLPIKWIKDNAAKFIGDIGSKVTDVVSGVKDGLTQTRARAVARTYGWGSGAEWEAIKWIVNKESSWDPRAANPTSSARGLFQKMTSIHGSVESTVEGQTKWGLNYIKNRYGSPTRAMSFWRRNNWYADGGLVKPHVFDGGGWLTDRMVAIHQKRRPDAVLSESQWRDMHTIAQNTAQRQGEGTTINITVNGVDTDNAQAVAQELRLEMARIAKGGKYALGNA